jgi:hypothetical protein
VASTSCGLEPAAARTAACAAGVRGAGLLSRALLGRVAVLIAFICAGFQCKSRRRADRGLEGARAVGCLVRLVAISGAILAS